MNKVVADGVGFEPTRRSHACRFSRPVPSTARPPIQQHYRNDLLGKMVEVNPKKAFFIKKFLIKSFRLKLIITKYGVLV